MPLGEFLGEVVFRGFLEVVFYFFFYYSGAAVLGVLFLGRLPLAPLSALDQTNRGKNRWNDWSPWLQPNARNRRRRLKAEWVCLVGLLFWVGAGIGAYFILR